MPALAITPNPRKSILVADDNQVVLATLSRALRADGYEVATASSGSETVKFVQESRPDLVLLDLDFPPDSRNPSCPLEDGFAILSWLRTMGGAAKTPIIVISGTDPVEHHNRAEAAGVRAFFQKPLDHGRLLEFIHKTFDNPHHSISSHGKLAA
jgi:CheY-like chemotaxis protein